MLQRLLDWLKRLFAVLRDAPRLPDKWGKQPNEEGEQKRSPMLPPAKAQPVQYDRDVLAPFVGPTLPRMSGRGYSGFAKVYGRPPQSARSEFPGMKKCKMNWPWKGEPLPGKWNGGNTVLYCAKMFEPYLREALRRCEEFGVIDYFERIGCYNHRKIRHKKSNPYSLHAWGAAVDINAGDNKSISQKRGAKKIPMPFSRRWLGYYEKGQPYLLVRAFLSVGLTWGGCWHRKKWIEVVEGLGVGYSELEAEAKYPEAVKEWRSMTYCDPMHWEATKR